MIQKVLIANRGEIAVRIIRSAKKMGIKTVAVYSEPDAEALHVQMADEKVFIGKAPANESYLVQDKIIDAAKQTGADAIHPGYGFLSENAAFADLCKQNNIIFIGPSSFAMATMGDKITARKTMIEAGVNVVPGYQGEAKDDSTLLQEARKIGYPIMVKATAGGGGKGMRLVQSEKDLLDAVHAAQSEAASAFGNATVYLEKFIKSPHHIEFQILADKYGNVIHLNERECSVQRRHQKVIEETPSPLMTPEVRKQMGEQAKQAAKAVNYVGAGTIEFLVDDELNYYFLEMNTRLQVEHPITEMTTGVDLVEQQFKIANGEKLTYTQKDIPQNGHAIECRIYAEDPDNNFMPASGKVYYMEEPKGAHIRVDGYMYTGAEVPIYYDPMIAKLIVWNETRQQAIDKMKTALENYKIIGIKHNIAFLHTVLQHPQFVKGQYDTRFIGLYSGDLSMHFDNVNFNLMAFAGYLKYHQLLGNNMKRYNPSYLLLPQILNIDINDEAYKVKILETYNDSYKIQVNNQTHFVTKHQLSDVKMQLVEGKQSHDFILISTKPNIFIINNKIYNFEVIIQDQKQIYAQQRKTAANEGDANFISTPIPGKVVKIPVSEGQEVEDGTTVIIVEAMKMQSEYKVSGNKIIKEIKVKEGDNIEGNQVLIVLENA